MKYILIIVLLIKLPSCIVSCKGCTGVTLTGFEDDNKNLYLTARVPPCCYTLHPFPSLPLHFTLPLF